MKLTAVLAALALAACAKSTPPPAAPGNASSDEPLEQPAPAADAPREPESVSFSNGRLVPSYPVMFETGTADLRPDAEPVLEAVRAWLADKPEATLLRIEGHSDARGDTGANQAMTEARALTVARWLVAHGVDCARVLPVGFGDTKPVAPNDTAEHMAMNRRIEFALAALRGRPIGGMPVDGGGVVAGDPCRE